MSASKLDNGLLARSYLQGGKEQRVAVEVSMGFGDWTVHVADYAALPTQAASNPYAHLLHLNSTYPPSDLRMNASLSPSHNRRYGFSKWLISASTGSLSAAPVMPVAMACRDSRQCSSRGSSACAWRVAAPTPQALPPPCRCKASQLCPPPG